MNSGSHMKKKDDAYDVVVGAGAAGLSAALVLGRARRRAAVIDAGAPHNAPAALDG
jgi:thioredoxin reductase